VLDLRVLFVAQRRLDRRRWQDEIRAAGFDSTLEGELPETHGASVFVPCRFEGLESGFDCLVEPFDVREWSLMPADASRAAAYDTVLTLETFPNAQEIAGSVTAAAAWAFATDGAILDAHFDLRLVEAAEALAWARRWLPEIRAQFDGPSRVRTSTPPSRGGT